MNNHAAWPPGGGSSDPGKYNVQGTVIEVSMVVHNPPDIPSKAEILGVVAVSSENADQNKYGWIVTDFLAWKTLFYRVGEKAAQFLERAGAVDGSIQAILGDKKDHISELPSNSLEFKTDLLKNIGDRARVAKERNIPLFLMVFAPVTSEGDICIDFANGGGKIPVATDEIRETIREAVNFANVSVILMTTSPFTGGWVCYPSFMGRTECATFEEILPLISKSCGAAFANHFTQLLSMRSTPLLADEQRARADYNDMMPIRPKEFQVNLLRQFQRKIHEVLEQRLCVLGSNHAIDCDPSNDTWEAYAPRRGRSLIDFWSKRWNKPQAFNEAVDRFEFLGTAFGGCRASQIFHLKYLAAIELEEWSCPKDSQRPNMNGITLAMLEGFCKTHDLRVEEGHYKRILDAIEFRASSMILAEFVAKCLDLDAPDTPDNLKAPKAPNSLRCRYWYDQDADDSTYHKFGAAFAGVHNLFDNVAVPPGETRHDFKHVRFWRASRWLSTAIANKFSDGSAKEIDQFVKKEVAPLFAKFRQMQLELLLQDKSVTGIGKKWLASINILTSEEAETQASGATIAEESTHGSSFPAYTNPQDQVVSIPAEANGDVQVKAAVPVEVGFTSPVEDPISALTETPAGLGFSSLDGVRVAVQPVIPQEPAVEPILDEENYDQAEQEIKKEPGEQEIKQEPVEWDIKEPVDLETKQEPIEWNIKEPVAEIGTPQAKTSDAEPLVASPLPARTSAGFNLSDLAHLTGSLNLDQADLTQALMLALELVQKKKAEEALASASNATTTEVLEMTKPIAENTAPITTGYFPATLEIDSQVSMDNSKTNPAIILDYQTPPHSPIGSRFTEIAQNGGSANVGQDESQGGGDSIAEPSVASQNGATLTAGESFWSRIPGIKWG
ncbi:hypothetical protein B0H63DRAFT_504951 [Podospora didyma]|uniref:Uncharacterized protein n=1 Tax=Podospora didyma TaxID=330526 RepID=A0AAE0P418_9PEZI|nr:hypothetical protein B0H63DRAFT_504951 [Podospora didyma]